MKPKSKSQAKRLKIQGADIDPPEQIWARLGRYNHERAATALGWFDDIKNPPVEYVRADLYEIAYNEWKEWERHYETLRTENAKLREKYDLLRDAVNEWDGDCDPECDSHGHTETCGWVDLALIVGRQQAEIERLRELVTELADDLEVEINVRYGPGEPHPALRGRFERDMEVIVRARAATEGEK